MGSLIINEWIKLWTKKQPWIFVGAIVILTVSVGFMYNSFENSNSANQGNWQVQLEVQIDQEQEMLNSPDVNEWEQDMAQRVIEENEAYLAAGINPFETNNIKFMNDTMLGVASFITLFSVIVASTIVTSELNTGTIKQLVIRPYERWQFLMAKFITVVLFSLTLIASLFIVNLVIGTLLFGNGSWTDPILEYSFNGTVNESTAGALIFSKLGLYTLNMLVFVVISFSLSTLFKSQALAVGIGIFTLFFTNILSGFNMLLEDTAWYKFLLFPHLNLPQYVNQETLMAGVTLPFSLTILTVYVLVFLALTTVYFQKKDIAY